MSIYIDSSQVFKKGQHLLTQNLGLLNTTEHTGQNISSYTYVTSFFGFLQKQIGKQIWFLLSMDWGQGNDVVPTYIVHTLRQKSVSEQH